MPSRPKRLKHLCEARIDRHGDNVGARDHDVCDTDLVQRQHVGEHLALKRREAGGLGNFFDRLLDILAQRAAAEPEQGTQPAEQALLAGLFVATVRVSVDAHSTPATRMAYGSSMPSAE